MDKENTMSREAGGDMSWEKRARAVSDALYPEGDRRRLGAYSGFMYGVGSALTEASDVIRRAEREKDEWEGNYIELQKAVDQLRADAAVQRVARAMFENEWGEEADWDTREGDHPYWLSRADVAINALLGESCCA